MVTQFHHCKPTATNVDTLENKLAKIAAQVKMSLFTQVTDMAIYVVSSKMMIMGAIIGGPDSKHIKPEPPKTYNPAINAAIGDIQWKFLEAAWDKCKEDIRHYLRVQEVLCNLITGAYDHQYLRELK